MLKRNIAILLFHCRVLVTKTLIFSIIIPLLAVMIPLWLRRREMDWAELRELFDLNELNQMFDSLAEVVVGCRWFVKGLRERDINKARFTPYTFWDEEERVIGCLFLDDAVTMNLMFGGTLTQKILDEK